MNTDLMFSSATCEWGTPQELFDQLNAEFHFTLDPCARKENAKCHTFYTKEDDGLAKDWKGSVFVNPPYGRELEHWMAKAYNESHRNQSTIVCLVPARTDTRWWHNYAIKGSVRFLKGRLKFDLYIDQPMKENVKALYNIGTSLTKIAQATKVPKVAIKAIIADRPVDQMSAPFPSAIVIFKP